MINKTLFYIILITGLILVLSWFFSDIFFYLIFSIVISTILRPLVTFINHTTFFGARTPRPIAVLFAFLLLILVITSFFVVFIPLISDQLQVLALLNLEDIYQNLAKPINFLENLAITKQLTTQPEGFIGENLKKVMVDSILNTDFQKLINGVINFTGGFFVALLAITFITFFLLLENGILRRQIIAVIPNQYFEVFIAAIFKIEQLLSNYLIGLLFQMLSIFTIASVGLSILGIKYALTIGLFAAVANLIPYAGPILGAAFGVFVTLSTSFDPAIQQSSLFIVLKVLSVFAVVQATDNVILQPLIFSKSVKAHPLEIFVVIFAGATIAGIPGMIAAIPVYTIFRVSAIEISSGFKRYRIFKI